MSQGPPAGTPVTHDEPALELEEEPGQRRGGAGATLRRLARGNTLWIFLVLGALVVAFSLARPESFASVFNLRNIAIDAAALLVIAVGMTYVIITAGIDLSVGSVLVFSGVIAAKVFEWSAGGDASTAGWDAIGRGFAACLASGLLWGILNGLLIAKGRIPALIVTLGTLGMALGAAQLITGGIDVRGIPQRLTVTVGLGRLFGLVPWIVVVAVVVTTVGALMLAFSRFGRYTYAIGSNAEAARRAGINVEAHLIKVYALSGLLSGLAGFLSLARFGTTTIAGHATDNLQAIAAVVLGGTSLFGGIGTVLGTVAGVFIPAVLQNGFVILGVQPFWQSVAVGAFLVAAVYVDQLRRRARPR
jgi:ribose transport system permease protein